MTIHELRDFLLKNLSAVKARILNPLSDIYILPNPDFLPVSK